MSNTLLKITVAEAELEAKGWFDIPDDAEAAHDKGFVRGAAWILEKLAKTQEEKPKCKIIKL